jgi:hypothetical protein
VRKPKTGDRKPWPGGYARYVEGVGWTFYLKTRKPVPIERCTGVVVQSLDDDELALAHLDAFRRNPEAYNPKAVRIGGAPLFLDDALGREFLEYLAAPQDKGGKGDSPGHLKDTRCALAFWRDKLRGRDLRSMKDAGEIRLAPGTPGFRYKTAAIKTLLSWLRKVRVDAGKGLSQGEGPDERLLVLPQWRKRKLHDPKLARAKIHKGQRALVGYYKVRAHLLREIGADRPPLKERAARSREEAQLFLLALDVLAATGLHVRELTRWIELGGIVEPMPAGREQEGAGVLFTIHKRGEEHRVAVSAEVLAQAGDLYGRALAFQGKQHMGWDPVAKVARRFPRRPFPEAQFAVVIKRACKIVGCEPFGPGSVRHAVETFAKSKASATALISKFVGHANEKLDEGVYIDPAVQVDAPVGLPRLSAAAAAKVTLPAPSSKVPARIPTPRGAAGTSAA